MSFTDGIKAGWTAEASVTLNIRRGNGVGAQLKAAGRAIEAAGDRFLHGEPVVASPRQKFCAAVANHLEEGQERGQAIGYSVGQSAHRTAKHAKTNWPHAICWVLIVGASLKMNPLIAPLTAVVITPIGFLASKNKATETMSKGAQEAFYDVNKGIGKVREVANKHLAITAMFASLMVGYAVLESLVPLPKAVQLATKISTGLLVGVVAGHYLGQER